MSTSLAGIYAASVTPFDDDGIPALHLLSIHLRYLESNGCTGALILGTTGEGPSFSVDERISILEAAAAERGKLRLLAGTGAASLTDAITLTHAAFELGYDGVVVVPPRHKTACSHTILSWSAGGYPTAGTCYCITPRRCPAFQSSES
jgi:dihydrodipicolinate synthase/N-acetylneuraminate lyase